MIERCARKSVAFDQPFLDRSGGEYPAGTYNVDITEELIEGLSFLAYRTVSASLVLTQGLHSYQLVPIDPSLVRAVHSPEGTSSISG